MSVCERIFDFDGTLTGSGLWFIRTLSGLADRHGFRMVSADDIDMLRSKPNRGIIRYLGIRLWQMPAIARDLRKESADTAASTALFDAIPKMLRCLKATDMQIAVVSSNDEDTFRRRLGESAALIDHSAGGVTLSAMLQSFAARAGSSSFERTKSWQLGAQGRDVEAAHRAGIASAPVTSGYATERVLRECQPAFLTKSVDELITMYNVAR